jgi:hypothetical protein
MSTGEGARGGGGGEPRGFLVAQLYALEWGLAAMGRDAGFGTWLGHGTGLICTGIHVKFCERNKVFKAHFVQVIC